MPRPHPLHPSVVPTTRGRTAALANSPTPAPPLPAEAATHLNDLTLLLKLLRALRGWGQAELAEAAGIDPCTINRYEGGKTIPARKAVERLVSAAGLPMSFVEACLLPALRAARTLVRDSESESIENLFDPDSVLDDALASAARCAIAASVGYEQPIFQEPWPRQIEPVAEDRLAAEEAWDRLRLCTAQERLFLVERAPEFRTWAVAERLCDESVTAAAESANRALEIVELAVHISTLSGGDSSWRSSLEGYTLGFLANALRVRGYLAKAEETFESARVHLRLEQENELLPIWQLHAIEASLRNELGSSAEALMCVDRATNSAPKEQAAQILLKKSVIFMRIGELKRAVEVLREVESVLDPRREPRLEFILFYNLTACMCRLGRYVEAEALLAQVHQLAISLPNDFDRTRVIHLEGLLAAATGRFSEARSKFGIALPEISSRGFNIECVTKDLNALDTAQAEVESAGLEPNHTVNKDSDRSRLASP